VTQPAHPKLDVLAVGAHPDDVELACGGTLALAVRRGRTVGIVHLTGGESGTRGTLEERREEAAAAARALGAASLDLLDCGDGELRTGRAEEDALIRLLRRYRPEVVLSPPPEDRHPDHGRAHRLVAAAAFYAGLAGRRLPGEDAGLPPHRPAAVYHYMQHDSFDPAFVVDVTAAWDAKKAALACYASQLQVPAEWRGEASESERDEPVTKVATREFSLAVEGRMRHFGLLIGAALGEPFGAGLPLAVRDLLDALPGGVR
jgi:N-acetylglucosamine malate deacetylase 1